MNQAIALIAPSFNAPRQTISDGTDHLNPASLRGLGPEGEGLAGTTRAG